MTTARHDRVPIGVWAACLVAIAAAVALVVVALQPVPPRTATDAGGPATGLSAADAGLLSAVAVAGGGRAPGFTLTDQRGSRVSLEQLRGRAVVLTFDDDRCTDICTLYAQDVLDAVHDLGADRSHVAFVSVNANPYYPSVADVRAWTDRHGLGATRGWYSLTGTPSRLGAVAAAYQQTIRLDPSRRTIEHSTQIAFLDPSGRERLAGMYGTESADTAFFGHALADAAVSMLPAGERRAVAGTSGPFDTDGGMAVHPGGLTLPALGGGAPVTVRPGRVTVLVFFSSTCAACAAELPGIEREYRARHARDDFVGVDVADHADDAGSLVRRAGLRFPVGVDASGATAVRFGAAELPFTVLLSPDGTVQTAHPGLLTTDQLDYLLQVLPAT